MVWTGLLHRALPQQVQQQQQELLAAPAMDWLSKLLGKGATLIELACLQRRILHLHTVRQQQQQHLYSRSRVAIR
jgi:hypothetical protein